MKEPTPKKEAKAKKEPAPEKEMVAPAKAKMESAPLPAVVPTVEASLRKGDDEEGPNHEKGTQEGGVRGHCSASGGGARRRSLA
jgi:hypothetical protein